MDVHCRRNNQVGCVIGWLQKRLPDIVLTCIRTDRHCISRNIEFDRPALLFLFTKGNVNFKLYLHQLSLAQSESCFPKVQ